MSSINRVTLMGRLGADPEIRRMNSGDPIVNLRVATSEVWRDKQTGEKKERSEWHQVVIFNKHICEIAEKYLKKGNLVYLEGMLCTRKWEDQAGQPRYSTEVVLKEFNGELKLLPQGSGRQGAAGPDDYGSQSGGSSSSGSTRQERGNQNTQSYGSRDLDDEIPF
jgi:single-strand DNA-binding protein